MKPQTRIDIVKSILDACDIQRAPDAPINIADTSIAAKCRGSAERAARKLAAYYSLLDPEINRYWDKTIEVTVSKDGWRGIGLYPSGTRLEVEFFHHR